MKNRVSSRWIGIGLAMMIFNPGDSIAKTSVTKSLDGSCCVRKDPNGIYAEYDCAAREPLTWLAINNPNLTYTEALNLTCNQKFSPDKQPCVWNEENPNCQPKPTPTPKPSSGACCLIKPGADPLLDCSHPGMNLGNPSGIPAGRLKCISAGQGNSCYWDNTNPKCCQPGIQGCGSTPGTLCTPPSISIPYPFESLAIDPALLEQYQYCKKQAALSNDPKNYYCCVKPTPKDPCTKRGMYSVSTNFMNLLEKGYLCCSSKNPRTDLLNGNKVCCEFIKKPMLNDPR